LIQLNWLLTEKAHICGSLSIQSGLQPGHAFRDRELTITASRRFRYPCWAGT